MYNCYFKNSRIPKRYEDEIQLIPIKDDFDSFKRLQYIKEHIVDFVKRGDNLFLYSHNCGNGKTTWATKIMKEYINQVQNYAFSNNTPALFINTNNFLNKVKLSISDPSLKEEVNEIKKLITESNLVIFDDFGDKTLSEFELCLLYDWIDTRISNLKSCIYTSNQSPDELKRVLDGKLYSRVIKATEKNQIKFYSGDRRGL